MLTAFFIRVLNKGKAGFDESEALRPVLESIARDFDAQLKDASDYTALGKISDLVMRAIESAEVVFADANSANENVWYEIGYADKTDVRKVVCLFRSDRALPFDRTDMLSVPYDDTPAGFERLRERLSRILADLLCDKRLRELFASEQIRAAADYLSSSRLRIVGIDWLLGRVRDEHEAEFIRIAAFRTLAALGALQVELLEELLTPLQRPALRRVAFQEAAKGAQPLRSEAWNPAVGIGAGDDLRREYTEALVQHWLRGYIDPMRLRDIVTSNADRAFRTNILMAFQKVLVETELPNVEGASRPLGSRPV